ncbi:MAG: hypothetical protein K2Q32_04425 [Alphaproteobacteria bacterium]|nr:hypothetical protein [Alphaproteobacteria bacterium]
MEPVMAKIEHHDFTFEQDPGIVLRTGDINIAFVDDEVALEYIDGEMNIPKSATDNHIFGAIYTIANLLKKDGLSANFLIFNDPLIAKQYIADNAERLTLLISDNNMPGISGFDMIQEMRAKGITVPAIIRSGLPNHIPAGMIVVGKEASLKAMYTTHIRPILEAQGHLNVDGNNMGIEQAAKPAP